MNVFGKRSKEIRETLMHDLQLIGDLALKRSPVDFGYHAGARTVKKQQFYYDNNKSKINPKKYLSVEKLAEKAKHIVIPGNPEFEKSRAVDFHVAEKHNGKSLTWDKVHMAVVAGVWISCAQELYEAGKITHLIRWGNDWDSDGVIALDHKFKDGPHLELIKPNY